jgi:hypothetical protein
MILLKKPDRINAVKEKLDKSDGEITRHLRETRIGPRTEDRENLVADYPLLPVRRRFWEQVIRAVDPFGTAAQLGTQLRKDPSGRDAGACRHRSRGGDCPTTSAATSSCKTASTPCPRSRSAATLRTPDDVELWLSATRDQILERLKEGLVIIH